MVKDVIPYWNAPISICKILHSMLWSNKSYIKVVALATFYMYNVENAVISTIVSYYTFSSAILLNMRKKQVCVYDIQWNEHTLTWYCTVNFKFLD